ncbi:MAG TPA: GNAT family N-acetyltransferase [Acidimicrobiia bacterium]|jgi:ribosomal protein S18 acetylase RimI-like enzyme|nr:GNAT family N-acetyltransferase [Acidimicrobiia bacterium]
MRKHVVLMELRLATGDDVEAIAALHADSWRRNYRGAYLDSYLDGDVVADRLAVWSDRIAHAGPAERTIVAERDGEFLGFAHTKFDEDPIWGALLDNLHVVHDHKGLGIGTSLLSETARAVLARPAPTGLYLWVLEQNTAAQAFYAARGGREVGRELRGPFPGGGTAVGLRIAWPDPSVLCRSG